MSPLVVGFSGKRKSGKDFVCDKLFKALQDAGYRVERRGVSYPLKEEYGRIHGLDGERLKFDLAYKEQVRKDMVIWGEKIRNQTPDYFCRKTVEAVADLDLVDVLVITDCRRPPDLAFFSTNFKALFVRVQAGLDTRIRRGFVFEAGVDDGESECALDDVHDWSLVVDNNGQPDLLENQLGELVGLISHHVQHQVER